MDKLEGLFKQNKEAFDRLTADEERQKSAWSSIEASLRANGTLDNSHKKHKARLWMRFAAVFIVLVGVTAVFVLNSKTSGQFENLSLTSPDGKVITLDPSQNKVTLIQFWASGNIVCDEENCYYYLPAYEKYKDRGFEIYAISLDDDREEWVNSIEENELPWIHVSDLQGWQSELCIECNITKVPTSFLVDQKGNVIARDVNAALLDATLSELLTQN